MKRWAPLLVAASLVVFGCGSDDSGSSESPAFDVTGRWSTPVDLNLPLVVSLVLSTQPGDLARVSGQWGSQGDDCFASGDTNGYNAVMSGNRLTLWLTFEAGQQVTQVKAELDAYRDDVRANLSGPYTIVRQDSNPDCVGRVTSVLLECEDCF